MQGGMTEPDYLQPTRFIDSGEPAVRAFAQDAVKGIAGDKARAIALYYAVRDGVAYDPYLDYTEPDVFRAGAVLAGRRGFCAGKSSLLAASARAVGIPARVGFADVRNHLNSKRLRELVEGDTFFWHSYTEIKIDGAWVKCTPAFDRELCARARIAPLEFDGDARFRCSIRSTPPGAGTWNTSTTAAASRTCRWRPSWPISTASIPS